MQRMKAKELMAEKQREAAANKPTKSSRFDLEKVLDFIDVHEIRKKIILEKFIKFFIEMTKTSRKWRANGQVKSLIMIIRYYVKLPNPNLLNTN